jgi:hypothetical protein
VRVDGSSFDMQAWRDWLISAPEGCRGIHVDGVYERCSSVLLVICMPGVIWDVLRRDPAFDLIGMVNSRNMVPMGADTDEDDLASKPFTELSNSSLGQRRETSSNDPSYSLYPDRTWTDGPNPYIVSANNCSYPTPSDLSRFEVLANPISPVPPNEMRVDDTARDHALYRNVLPHTDGLYHCPWEGKEDCYHRPEKLRCNYESVPPSSPFPSPIH